MGLSDSPYRYLQLLIRVNIIDYGERKYPLNPFQLSHAKLNLPGDKSYASKLPLVTKVRSDRNLASEVFIYVDDGRIIAHSELVYWQAAKSSLGIQDSSRKRTEPFLTPVPWDRTVAHTSNKEVAIIATQIKWGKTRILLLELETLMR